MQQVVIGPPNIIHSENDRMFVSEYTMILFRAATAMLIILLE